MISKECKLPVLNCGLSQVFINLYCFRHDYLFFFRFMGRGTMFVDKWFLFCSKLKMNIQKVIKVVFLLIILWIKQMEWLFLYYFLLKCPFQNLQKCSFWKFGDLSLPILKYHFYWFILFVFKKGGMFKHHNEKYYMKGFPNPRIWLKRIINQRINFEDISVIKNKSYSTLEGWFYAVLVTETAGWCL